VIQNFCATCRVCAGTAHAKEHDCCTGETKYRQTRPLETKDRSGNTVTCLVQIARPSRRPSGILIPPGSARGENRGMTGVLYTTSGHDRCFALARITGGAGLEASWARRLGDSPPVWGGTSRGRVFRCLFWGSRVEQGWEGAFEGVGR